jgi:hypothetical protein
VFLLLPFLLDLGLEPLFLLGVVQSGLLALFLEVSVERGIDDWLFDAIYFFFVFNLFLEFEFVEIGIYFFWVLDRIEFESGLSFAICYGTEVDTSYHKIDGRLIFVQLFWVHWRYNIFNIWIKLIYCFIGFFRCSCWWSQVFLKEYLRLKRLDMKLVFIANNLYILECVFLDNWRNVKYLKMYYIYLNFTSDLIYI